MMDRRDFLTRLSVALGGLAVFPTIEWIGPPSALSPAHSVTAVLPEGIAEGDLLLMMVAGDGAGSLNKATMPGWKMEQHQSYEAEQVDYKVFYRIEKGQPGSATIEGLEGESVYCGYCVRGHQGDERGGPITVAGISSGALAGRDSDDG